MRTTGLTMLLLAAALGACAGNEAKGRAGDDGWRSMPPVAGGAPEAPPAQMPPDTTVTRVESPEGTTTTRATTSAGPSAIRLGANGRVEGRLEVPKGATAHVGLVNRGPGQANASIRSHGFGGDHAMFDGPIEHSVGAKIERGDEKTMIIVIESRSATTIDVELTSIAYGDPVPDIQWDLSRAGN